MIISVEKAHQQEELAQVLRAYPSLFDINKTQSADQLIMLAFLYFEMQKGKNSYWYPWLRMLPDVDFSCGWNSEDMDSFQDYDLVDQLHNYDAAVCNEWKLFRQVLVENPRVFESRFIDEELFKNVYA